MAVTLASAVCQRPGEPPWLRFDWPEADSLFQRDASWVGGDGAYSIDLGAGRVLWLFGDSWIDPSRRHDRRHAVMVSNTIGLQTGYDPARASMRFSWGQGRDGEPQAFFPDTDDHRYWPGHGLRLGHRLLLFLMVVEGRTDGLGFEITDWDAILVQNPDEEPSRWVMEWLETPPNALQVIVGSGGVLRDGEYVYAFGSQEPSSHDIYLARWKAEELSLGELSGMEWWGGEEEGWIPDDKLGTGARPVLERGQTEFTVHRDRTSGKLVQTQTVGFGPAAIVRRTAPSVTGPWSPMDTVFVPAQGEFPRVLIYQGKAHPHLEGAGLVLTYSTNSLDFDDQLAEDWLYYPRFVREGVKGPVGSEF